MEDVQPFLDAVNQHIGYQKYKVHRYHASTELWCIDVYGKSGRVNVTAERIGTQTEIEMFIRGMFQMVI